MITQGVSKKFHFWKSVFKGRISILERLLDCELSSMNLKIKLCFLKWTFICSLFCESTEVLVLYQDYQ